MIVCKPKSSVFRVLVLVQVLLLVSLGYAFSALMRSQTLWMMVLVVFLCIIFLVLLTRMVMLYRTLTISNEKVTVSYHILGRRQQLDLSTMRAWEEIVIKTNQKQPYRQLVLHFAKTSLKLSSAEFTNYDKLHRFLEKKVIRKKKRG